MEIYVDDAAIESDFVGERTVEEVLRHVQSHHCTEDHVVVGVRCDGNAIPPDELPNTMEQRAAGFDRLDVVTGTKGALVCDAMQQASNCLKDTESTCERVALLFSEGKTVEAAQMFGDCMRTWQQIHEAVGKSIEMLQLDLSETTINGETLSDLIGKPRDALMQIKQTMQAQDYVQLSDILRYEFREVTESWHALVVKLQHEAEQRMEDMS